MNFVLAQAQARRRSRWLLLWFALAIVVITWVIYAALWLAINEVGPFWNPALFTGTLVATAAVIGGGAIHRTGQLAQGGGEAVAESLGGQRLRPGSSEIAERRLENVVEEMAIAAGLPVPATYVLDDAIAINAFAAGSSPQQAVIAVTRGALISLNRDELQGVVGHEFSHILNGDMRLNIRLVGLLHGLMLLATLGRMLLRNTHKGDRRAAGATLLLGLALLLTGWLGVFFGRLIQAGVSRQREYLADASAVQFTRNPQGITGALRKIANDGAKLSSPAAETVSHMLFGGESLFGWFSTHPPVAERIARILGTPVAFGTDAQSVQSGREPGHAAAGFGSPGQAGIRFDRTTAPSGKKDLGEPSMLRIEHRHLVAAAAVAASIPAPIREILRTEEGARAAIFALLLDSDPALRARQLALLGAIATPADKLAALLPASGSALRMAVIDLTLGALKAMSRASAAAMIDQAEALVRVDGQTLLAEFLFVRLLRDALIPVWSPPIGVEREKLPGHLHALVSWIAHVGHEPVEQAQAAYDRGALVAPMALPAAIMPREDMRIEMLESAFTDLAGASGVFRLGLVGAMAEVVRYDRRVTEPEAELLRVAVSALGVAVPIPLSLGDTEGGVEGAAA